MEIQIGVQSTNTTGSVNQMKGQLSKTNITSCMSAIHSHDMGQMMLFFSLVPPPLTLAD